MRIFEHLSEIENDKNTVLTLGTFDGIHLGHQALVKAVAEKAKEIGGRNLVITFFPHPKKVITGNDVKVLTTLDEKKILLKQLGVENLFIINFTKDFSKQTAEEFLKNYVINSIGVKEIVIGYDHHFGKGRGGNEETLKEMGNEFGFSVSVIDEYRLGGEVISSTKIREAVSSGDAVRANRFLGRRYSFSGTVVEGDKRGRELGFPTANIEIGDKEKLLPQIGIYAVKFFVDDESYNGLLSIGKRPTFYEEGRIIPEVYIYDFNKDIYGRKVTVELVEKIRGEEKFNTAEELIARMNEDKKAGLKILTDKKKI